jgi:molybdopterin-binding protein
LLPEDRVDLKPEDNVIAGMITRVTPMETQFKVTVDCSLPITVLVSKQAFLDLSLAKGRQVRLTFKPGAVHVLPRS